MLNALNASRFSLSFTRSVMGTILYSLVLFHPRSAERDRVASGKQTRDRVEPDLVRRGVGCDACFLIQYVDGAPGHCRASRVLNRALYRAGAALGAKFSRAEKRPRQ